MLGDAKISSVRVEMDVYYYYVLLLVVLGVAALIAHLVRTRRPPATELRAGETILRSFRGGGYTRLALTDGKETLYGHRPSIEALRHGKWYITTHRLIFERYHATTTHPDFSYDLTDLKDVAVGDLSSQQEIPLLGTSFKTKGAVIQFHTGGQDHVVYFVGDQRAEFMDTLRRARP